MTPGEELRYQTIAMNVLSSTYPILTYNTLLLAGLCVKGLCCARVGYDETGNWEIFEAPEPPTGWNFYPAGVEPPTGEIESPVVLHIIEEYLECPAGQPAIHRRIQKGTAVPTAGMLAQAEEVIPKLVADIAQIKKWDLSIGGNSHAYFHEALARLPKDLPFRCLAALL